MTELILVGAGSWGQRCISVLSSFPGVRLKVAHRDDWKQVIDEGADGVIVCTPPSSHVEVATHALRKNIPVMIEKPLALSLVEARQLQSFQNIPILADHTHLFSDAYQGLRETASKYKIEKIVSNNYNKGPIRDYSSLWDYGSHDVSMILDLNREMPQSISVQETKQSAGSLFKVEMNFENLTSTSLIGNGGKKKVRQLKVLAGGLEISYDERNQPSPPLTNAFKVFINAIHGMHDYRLGIDLSLDVLSILEQCDQLLLGHN